MRKLSGYFVLVLVAAWLAAGCAWVKQDAKLQLNPQIARSEIGAGRRVAVRVQDRRTTQVLGYRGMDSKNAAITCGQDLAALFEAKIVEGMEQKGFTVARVTDQRPDVVNIDIRQIEYTTDLEFMKGSMQVRTVLRVHTSRNGLYFDQNYQGARKETIIEAPKASRNERIINASISDAVQRMFEDERLMQFLVN